MKTINSNFVPYEIALILKEKGFNESCLATYCKRHNNPDEILVMTNEEWMTKDTTTWVDTETDAPLYQQVIAWLNGKDIHLSSIWYNDEIYPPKWTYHVNKQYIGTDLNAAIIEAIKLLP